MNLSSTEYIELGPVPCNEECTSTNEENPDYVRLQKIEMLAYKHQLERLFPDCDFRIKRFPHDFGSYGEVCIFYTPGTPKEDDAYEVEKNLPKDWDEASRDELAAAKRPLEPAGHRVGLLDGE